MALCYLAGPIDFADPFGPVSQLRAECTEALIEAGFAVFDPSCAYKGAMADPKAVMAYNEAAIERADCMLAMLPKGAPSIGTPMEIAMAVELSKPIAVVGALGSMQLEAMGVTHGCTPADAVEWLRMDCICGPDPAPAIPVALKYTADDSLFEPWRQFDGDAGFDLVVTESVTVPAHGFVDVPCGVQVELPPGTWGMLTGRSSTIRKRGLLVNQGIIDNGYRGDLFAAVWNLTDSPVDVGKGERIAQLIVLPLSTCDIERVDELSDTPRGTLGFGSTGT